MHGYTSVEYFGKCGNFSSVSYIKLKLLFIFNNETNEVKLNAHFHDSNVTRDTMCTAGLLIFQLFTCDHT